ncbi:hypothetical protein E3P92_02011 [Wallemia ichthyophaga]|uniref:Large ribosomal subunit protein uL15/eL18 domain-containing protein n=2 Tax=Wallemia ichthyophaga TaxID=245174 RepID=A0A4V4M9Q7_WALIC|nr:uncharacterized protein J056_001357 [Wallemia ichthyophaga EXF-994]TIA72089.1 hypothetical protein E3P91_02231 [Wallemia ichthyophaga]EOQ99815.1 hypothetical protein J056_001357 [Wallemia ichthyophaga EXF-994]TIA84580.1 hypothetical protein E3P98_00029 [Wallemia ichthyophaga]TIA94061.1 hypothetical protein E3P97_00512 [Wallemia ichthyophaga]TIA99907.1 hypothetical protein E3P96_02807 [Wallemia ichthyophaga]
MNLNLKLPQQLRQYSTSIDKLSSFGVIHKSKRLGRGRSSNQGKTSGRGQNGQKSRGDGKVAPWFEGGQTPLTKRFPKTGFYNYNQTNYATVPLSRLAQWIQQRRINANTTITIRDIVHSNLVHGLSKKDGVKILSDLKPTAQLPPVHIEASSASKPAIEAIEAAGGSFTHKYFNKLSLRQHLNPHKFPIPVHEAAPTKKADILFYDRVSKR